MVEVASAEFQSAVGVVKCALLSQHVPAAGVVRVVLGSVGLRLLATDFERWCEICVGEAPGEGAQEVGVQAKRLMGLAAVLPSGRVALEISKTGALLVRAGTSRFTLPPIGLDDVPVSRPEVSGVVVADSRVISTLLKRASHAVSGDVSRPTLAAVRVEAREGRLEVVSTDGKRLFRASGACRGEVPASLFPGSGIAGVERVAGFGPETEVLVGGSAFGVRCGPALFVSLLIEGQYPNIDAVIPTPDRDVAVALPARAFDDALRRALVASGDDPNKGVRLVLEGDHLEVLGAGEGAEAQDSVPAPWDRARAEVLVNASQLQEAVAAVVHGAESLTLEVRGSLQAVVLRGEEALALVMPLRA